MEGPDLDELGRENMSAALAVVKSTAPRENAEKVEAQFKAADPTEKTNMFLKAIRAQMKARAWPSAFLLAMAYLPGDTPHPFITKLNPSEAAGWKSKSLQERAEAAWQALQILVDKLESAASDETGATWVSMSRDFGLNAPDFQDQIASGKFSAKIFPTTFPIPRCKTATSPTAGMFHALWTVEAAVYY